MSVPGFINLMISAEDHGKILLALFIALIAAKLMAELFERLRQPAVVGEIIAGIIVGPALLNWVQPTDVLDALGGADNLKSQQRVALTRVRVQLQDAARVDVAALKAAGVPGVMVLAGGTVHLLTGLQGQ